MLACLLPAMPGSAPAQEAEAPREISLGESAADLLRIVTEEGYLDYDEESGVIYANKRTRIHYQGLTLAADNMSLDVNLQEATAVGNVVFTAPGSEIKAERLRYNFKTDAGTAVKARGYYGPLHFRYSRKEDADQATFERVSEDEAIFRNVEVTTCDFKKPHYSVRAKEVLLYQNDRIFLKGATLYMRDKFPVLYLPFYTRSLREGSPWMVRAGYESDVGPWLRLGYVYNHENKVPSFEDEDEMVTRSKGKLRVFADYLSKRGFGGGMDYKYSLQYDRHTGEISLYGLRDTDRKVGERSSWTAFDRSRTPAGNVVVVPGTTRVESESDDEETMNRYQAVIKHRTRITKDLDWLVNVDWMSDPEIYDDVLDLFREDQRKRVMERRARTALTWAREQFVARLSFEVKDRIGRDRITNFSDPGDYARDFDEQPNIQIKDRDDEGIPTRRWGRTTVRAPQVTVETAWLRLWQLPIYYHTDINIFNNLDTGFNVVDRDDDSYVRGGDWYHAFLWRWRISQRFTLLTQLGGGAGVAMREKDDFDYYSQARFNRLRALGLHNHIPYPSEGGLEFTDPETFLVGNEQYNLDDVNNGFGYGDFKTRLNARLTDALTGDLTYRYRATTDHNLGDWYAETGRRFVRSDLYNFRLRENNIDGMLRYNLAQPRMYVGTRVYHNLVGENDLYPLELKNQYALWSGWTNAADTVTVDGGVDLSDRQIYHPSDPRAFMDSSMGWRTGVGYRPLSKLWWTRWDLDFREELDQQVGNDNFDRYTMDENRLEVSGLLGGRIGPKWAAQVEGDFDSRVTTMRRLRFRFERDLHDALLLMSVAFEQDIYDDRGGNSSQGSRFGENMDFRIALQPKLPTGEPVRGAPGIETLQAPQKSMLLEPGF